MSLIKISDLSILLVEPSSVQLKVIIKHLKEEKIINIEGVTSGTAALKSLEDFQPDLIISSLYLPDMTAVELVTEIRHHEFWHSIPFMLISSETSFNALDPIRQAGVMAILPKPFDHRDLHRALKLRLILLIPKKWYYDILMLKR